jgi:hypothetical protein
VNTIPTSEIQKAPILRIEATEGLESQEEWTINACGLYENSEFIG